MVKCQGKTKGSASVRATVSKSRKKKATTKEKVWKRVWEWFEECGGTIDDCKVADWLIKLSSYAPYLTKALSYGWIYMESEYRHVDSGYRVCTVECEVRDHQFCGDEKWERIKEEYWIDTYNFLYESDCVRRDKLFLRNIREVLTTLQSKCDFYYDE